MRRINMRRGSAEKIQRILLSEPVWIKICRKIDEISRKDLIAGVIEYDSKRKKKDHPYGCVDRFF